MGREETANEERRLTTALWDLLEKSVPERLRPLGRPPGTQVALGGNPREPVLMLCHAAAHQVPGHGRVAFPGSASSQCSTPVAGHRGGFLRASPVPRGRRTMLSLVTHTERLTGQSFDYDEVRLA
ncbi:hypothetical protein ABZV75_37400 [Streptomyces flaveolus]|uniref:hypothetical protein n=1 Tax=Streptomyces flaveolus TaxID=67297 RepID=UPI0033BBCB62